MSLAKAYLSGTVTSDPEKRFTPNNHAVTNFNLAVEAPAFGKNAPAPGEETFPVKITCWRGLADASAEQLQKGDHILVEGKLIINSFQTQEGVQKKLYEVEAASIQKLPGAPQALVIKPGATSTPSDLAPVGAPSGNAPQFSSDDLMTEDDIPF